MPPVLSIIIPTYNSEEVIENAINSILQQSYKIFEIIVIDCLSSDKTIEIVKSYAAKESRIKFISEPDNGIYDAMNKGIALAHGEWIYFLGSDDMLANSNVLEIFERNYLKNFDVIYGNVLSSRFNGRYGGEFSIRKIYHQNICHQSIFFRKKIFDTIGFFNLKYSAHADWDSNLKWLLNKRIKKKYLSIDIAYYADGGFSSTLEGGSDKVFESDKDINFLRYCLNSPKDSFIINHSLRIFKASCKEANITQALFSGLIFLKQKILC